MWELLGSSPLTRGKPELRRAHRVGVGLIPAHAGKTETMSSWAASSGAHPRSRGENRVGWGPLRGREGSSPLTRGKPHPNHERTHSHGLIPAHAGKTLRQRRQGHSVHGSSPLTRGKRPSAISPRASPGLIPAHAGKTRSACVGSVSMRAHPRSRGENMNRSTSGHSCEGSSPLTRGKRGDDLHGRDTSGLIPAHAGKTRQRRPTGRCSRAHPRSRGENIISRDGSFVARGSSPLTRGKRVAGRLARHLAGLIPAHAGKTRSGRDRRRAPGAHPRSRGENAPPFPPASSALGSSPLTRGKHQYRVWRTASRGLIPAHAGKTTSGGSGRASRRAHPRSRGENVWEVGPVPDGEGSSPLTRGKRRRWWAGRGLRGLIPAHAGKTWLSCEPSLHVRAHPRSRGENSSALAFRGEIVGSSPLTRGKPPDRLNRRRDPGLIPAHAGKTNVHQRVQQPPGAHPRSRGENSSARIAPSAGGGSSPLTRGKHQRGRGERDQLGLIPAHAGKTIGPLPEQVHGQAHPRSRGENAPHALRPMG